jgi:hypothetical protein
MGEENKSCGKDIIKIINIQIHHRMKYHDLRTIQKKEPLNYKFL